jgi:hypothetical protein
VKCFRRAIDKGDILISAPLLCLTCPSDSSERCCDWEEKVRCDPFVQLRVQSLCSAVGYGNYMTCNYLWLCVNWIEVNILQNMYNLLCAVWWTVSISAFTECAFCKNGKMILKFFATVSHIFALRFRFKLNI